jgi:hypothetical protein
MTVLGQGKRFWIGFYVEWVLGMENMLRHHPQIISPTIPALPSQYPIK